MSDTADPTTWTGTIRTRDGKLPDLERVRAAVRGVGAPFSLRGVEAEVVGWLGGSKEAPELRIAGTGESVRLAPLTRKVQWDARGRKEAPVRRSERRAFERLMAGWEGSPVPVRITGPLRAAPDASPLRLEVRRFRPSRGAR